MSRRTIDPHKALKYEHRGHDITVEWQPLTESWCYRIDKPHHRGCYIDNTPHKSSTVAVCKALYKVDEILARDAGGEFRRDSDVNSSALLEGESKCTL